MSLETLDVILSKNYDNVIVTIQSFKILKDAGISIQDFEWENATETYLNFLNPAWKDKNTFLAEFEKELRQYPISCLENIVHVKGTVYCAISDMQKYTKEILIQACNNENDIQLKRKIAHALGSCYVNTPLHYFTIVVHDPDLCDKQRNKVWKEIIHRWRRKDDKTIDINNLREALRAIYERPIDKKSKGLTGEILKQLFRFRVFNKKAKKATLILASEYKQSQ